MLIELQCCILRANEKQEEEGDNGLRLPKLGWKETSSSGRWMKHHNDYECITSHSPFGMKNVLPLEAPRQPARLCRRGPRSNAPRSWVVCGPQQRVSGESEARCLTTDSGVDVSDIQAIDVGGWTNHAANGQ